MQSSAWTRSVRMVAQGLGLAATPADRSAEAHSLSDATLMALVAQVDGYVCDIAAAATTATGSSAPPACDVHVQLLLEDADFSACVTVRDATALRRSIAEDAAREAVSFTRPVHSGGPSGDGVEEAESALSASPVLRFAYALDGPQRQTQSQTAATTSQRRRLRVPSCHRCNIPPEAVVRRCAAHVVLASTVGTGDGPADFRAESLVGPTAAAVTAALPPPPMLAVSCSFAPAPVEAVLHPLPLPANGLCAVWYVARAGNVLVSVPLPEDPVPVEAASGAGPENAPVANGPATSTPATVPPERRAVPLRVVQHSSAAAFLPTLLAFDSSRAGIFVT